MTQQDLYAYCIAKLPEQTPYYSYNHCTEFPKLPGLPGLPRLPEQIQGLHFTGNQLTELPRLPEQLQELYCSHNQLQELPRLPGQLRELHCSYNQLRELPKLPGQLQELYCSGNPLSFLPVSLLVSGCYVDREDKSELYKNGTGYTIIRRYRQKRLKKWSIQWIYYPVMCQLFCHDIVTIINGYA